jgi:hypothetical protein
MSWSVSADFANPQLDHAKIEAACRDVAASRAVKLELRSENAESIVAFFTIAAAEARAWELRLGAAPEDLAHRWQSYNYDGTTDVPIEIDFDAFAADEDDAGFAVMTFKSNRSGNPLCAQIGQDILDALGACLGIECKPA